MVKVLMTGGQEEGLAKPLNLEDGNLKTIDNKRTKEHKVVEDRDTVGSSPFVSLDGQYSTLVLSLEGMGNPLSVVVKFEASYDSRNRMVELSGVNMKKYTIGSSTELTLAANNSVQQWMFDVTGVERFRIYISDIAEGNSVTAYAKAVS